MDSGKRHDVEVDTFEPVAARPGPDSSVEHIETETNVFSVDALRRAAAQHGGTDTGSFEVSASKRAAVGAGNDGGGGTGVFEISTPAQPAGGGAEFDLSAPAPSVGGADTADDFEPPASKRRAIDIEDDPLDDIGDPLDDIDDPLGDDDFPQKKGGFFANLFRRFSGRGNEDDLDDLSLDDDMFIAPPPVSGRTAGDGAATAADADQPTAAAAPVAADSGVFEFKPSADEPVPETSDEPPPATATATEVTDSGVFEFKPSTTDEPAPETKTSDEPPPAAATATEVTDSGVFEFKPSADEPVPETKTSDEPPSAATAPIVTDSGVFEFKPSADEPASEIKTSDEPPPAATAPIVTDSGVFEFKPSTDEPAAETIGEPPPAATAPIAADSGVFELGPAANKGGDEWEIGWEPEDDGVAAAAVVTEAPPPTFTKFAHVCLYVKDLGRSVEFYSKLGFQKRFVFNRNGNLFGAYLEFGDGNFVELFEDVSRSATASLGRLAHFCLETPDIDAAMESLSARGIGFSPKKLGCDSTYQIWLKDPDGNEFEIHQYTEKSSQIVGGEVEADW